MTGGGGGGACAHVVSKRNEDEKLLIAASNRTIIRLAQGAFPGADADDLRRRLGGGRRRHLKVLSLAKAADFDDVRLVKYVAFPGDFPDVRGFVRAGDIRIVAVLSPERPEQFDQDPTALAQGYDVTGPNWRGLYVPKGLSDDAGDMWNQPTQQMVASEEFQRIRAEQGIDPLDLLGAAAEEAAKENVAEIRVLSKETGLIQ
jgi:putative tricarboxylic transport membrane protein